MRIYFTYYLIPVAIAALLIFWLVLRNDRHRLLFALVLSVVVLALLNPAFAVIAVGLVLLTHQFIELWRESGSAAGGP